MCATGMSSLRLGNLWVYARHNARRCYGQQRWVPKKDERDHGSPDEVGEGSRLRKSADLDWSEVASEETGADAVDSVAVHKSFCC